MSLLNKFMLGADPEFVILNGEHLARFESRVDRYAPWGVDHGGWVIEPHPKPEHSVRALVENIKVAMNDFATVSPTGKWRAGAYVAGYERAVSMGGHVHIDKPAPEPDELSALNLFTQHLVALDILPAAECERRRTLGYGANSDIRSEHGHYEYRTFPSWLYSQRVTKLCTLATKLAAVEPSVPLKTLGRVADASLPRLKSFYEAFKGKDDDVDWVLDSGMLDKKLTIDPSKDLRDVWKVKPEKEKPHWKELVAQTQSVAVPVAPVGASNPVGTSVRGNVVYLTTQGVQLTLTLLAEIRERIMSEGAPLIPGNLYFTANRVGFRFVGIDGQVFDERMLSDRYLHSYEGWGRARFMLLANQQVGRTAIHAMNYVLTRRRQFRLGLLYCLSSLVFSVMEDGE